jgi:hypothetical protein
LIAGFHPALADFFRRGKMSCGPSIFQPPTPGRCAGRTMPVVRCPVCDRRFDSSESQTMPFCSDRCRRIDLGRWLGEEYSVPAERHDEDEELFEG